MILLDTNVISALAAKEHNLEVLRWLNGQADDSLATTSITIFELRTGLGRMAKGRRRQVLERALDEVLDGPLGSRVLGFDRRSAERSADLLTAAMRVGRPVELRDMMIAGIVAANRATLATRNARHFAHLGIDLVDPWTATG